MASTAVTDFRRLASGSNQSIYTLGNAAIRINPITGKIQYLSDLSNLGNTTAWKNVDNKLIKKDFDADAEIDSNISDGTYMFTNENATGGIVLTLPVARTGLTAKFLNVSGNGITIETTFTSPNTVFIYTGSTSQTELAKDTKGDYIELFAANENEWYSLSE